MTSVKNTLYTLFLFLITSNGVNAQKEIMSAKRVEKLIAGAMNKAKESCIKLVIRDTLNNRDLGGFSGVIVSEDGLVLTAAHSVMPAWKYRVELPDGHQAVAVALGKIALESNSKEFDLAMLKIEGPGKWPYARLGESRKLTKGEGCISISYPGSFFQVQPNLRFGRIVQLDDGYGYIQSSCKMEPGDSGGGLFNLSGELIGIHEKIFANENENFEIPVHLFRQYWLSLQETTSYDRLPDPEILDTPRSKSPYLIPDLSVLGRLKKQYSANTYSVHSNKYGSDIQILATAFYLQNNAGKNVFLVSKSSMVGTTPSTLRNSKNLPLSAIYRDTVNDLVILKFPEEYREILGIPMERCRGRDITSSDVGKIVMSEIGDKNVKIGVISTMEINMPNLFSKAKLGALVSDDSARVIVRDIAKFFPAENFLKIGDQIEAVNHKKVSNAQEYSAELNRLFVGDSLTLDIIRDGQLKTLKTSFKERLYGNVSNDYSGGRSFRSDGFEKVFVQDAAIKSDECGSPVYNLKGQLLGINIARHSRTSSIVLPMAIIKKTIMKAGI